MVAITEVQASESYEKPSIDVFVGDDIYFLSPEEVAATKPLSALSEFYIRKQPTNTDVEAKMKALVIDRVNDDETITRYCKVTEPWVVYIDPESGERYVVNGNTRREAYIRLQNSTAHKDVNFQDVAYRLFKEEPTVENLIDYQILVNDTTKEHDTLELASAATQYKEHQYQMYLKQGLKKTEAKGRSTRDVKARFRDKQGNPYSDPYLTRLKKISESSEYLKDLVRAGLLTTNAIAALDTYLNKDENNSLTEEAVISGIRASQAGTTEFVISDAAIHEYFKTRNAANPPAKKDDDNTPPTETPTKPAKTKEEIESMLTPMLTAILALDDTLASDVDKTENVVNLNAQMLNTLATIYPMLSVNHTQQFLGAIRDLFVQIIDDPKTVSEKVSNEGTKGVQQIGKLINSLKKVEIRQADLTGVIETDDAVTEDDQLTLPLVVSDEAYTAIVE
jgi:hypothetical protein